MRAWIWSALAWGSAGPPQAWRSSAWMTPWGWPVRWLQAPTRPLSSLRRAARDSRVTGAADGGLFAGPTTASADAPQATATATVSRAQLAVLRKELNGLIGAWSHRTGQPHGVIHNELRQACGGPALPQASAEQIKARIDKIRQWALSRR